MRLNVTNKLLIIISYITAETPSAVAAVVKQHK